MTISTTPLESRSLAQPPSAVLRTTATFLLFGAVALFGPSTGLASGNRGAFSEFDQSARATAWGTAAVVLTDRAESGRINPAGLLRLGQSELSVSYADLFGLDLVSQTQLHVAMPVARKELIHEGPTISRRNLPPPARFALGLSVTQLRGEAGPIGPTSTADTYRESEIGLSVAWRSVGGSNVGFHLRLLSVQSDLEDVSANGQAVGFGLQRDIGRWSFGLAADNLLASLNWKLGEDEPLPHRYHAGVAWSGLENRLRFAAGWSALGQDAKGSALGIGADWHPYEAFTLRGGLTRVEDVVGSETEPSAGLGFSWQGLMIDWGFRLNGRDLGTTHRWSASVGI